MSSIASRGNSPGLVRPCFNWVAKILAYVFLSFLILIVAHLIMVWYFGAAWTEQYMGQLLRNEARYIDSSVIDPIIGVKHSLNGWVQAFYQTVFIKSGIRQTILSLPSNVKPDGLLGSAVVSVLHWASEIGIAVIYAAPIAVLRLVILLLAIPLVGVFCLCAVIDGLTAREIRRYQNDRESSLLFHHSKRFSKISLWLGLTIFMLLPVDVPPTWILVPMSIGVWFGIYMTLKNYKKYL